MSRARDKANSTVSNFASTGIDDNADANAITIDSSENVLVDKTSSNYQTVGHELRDGGRAFHTADGGKTLSLNRLSSPGDIVDFYQAGTLVGSLGTTGGDLTIDGPSEHTGLRFEATDITPRHNGSASNGVNDLGTSAARFKDLYLSGGVYLGGTGSANHLDDYEEGTFTPTIHSGISVSSYDHQLGHYVKIGRQVTAWVFMEYNGSSRTSDILKIAGLPFTSSNNTSNEATFGGFITYQNAFSNAHNIVHVGRGDTKIEFYEADGSQLIGNELSGASGEVRVVVQYTV